MRIKFISFKATALAALLMLGACGENEILLSGESGGNGGNGGNGGGDQTPDVGEMFDTYLQGVVTDADGNPLQGVKVTSGTATVYSNMAGGFEFTSSNVVDSRLVARFEKDGYFSVLRSLRWENTPDWTVVMIPKTDRTIATSASFNSSSATRLNVSDFTVDLPAGSYVNKTTGERYDGPVKAEMVYLDPDTEDFAEMMPGGDMAGVRTDGAQSMLLSYGMTAVNLTDMAGNPLQLDGTNEATLTFPVPESLADRTPASIPLWSFNESTGLWVEEGVAELRDGVYVGPVKHFSWVNLDDPEEEAKVYGYVRNEMNMAIRGITVTINQISVKTDGNGYYECRVPSDVRFETKVNSKAYGRYKNIVSISVDPLSPGEERQLPTMILPRLDMVYGQIVNQGGGSNVCSIWMTYGNRTTPTVKSDQNGDFNLYSPEGYHGKGQVHVLTFDGIELDPIDVNLGNGDVSLGNIFINTQTGMGGILNISLPNGETRQLPVPAMDNGYNGVIIAPDVLTVMDEEEDFIIQIPGYSSDKTNYDGCYMQAGFNDESVVSMGTLNTTVRRSGNAYVFDMNGTGQYYSSDLGMLDVTLSAGNIGIPLLMKIYYKTNVSNPVKEAGLPSFTPCLSVAAPMVMVVEESSRMGKGGMVCYNGSEGDYTTLRNKVPKTFTVLEEDSYEEYGSICKDFAAYYGDNIIMISYDSSIEDIDLNDPESMNDPEARLTVTALTGVSEDFWDMMSRSGNHGANTRKLSKLLKCVR